MPSTPIGTKGYLYKAIGALEECVILSEKREPRKKDDLLNGYTMVELWLIFRTKKMLPKIKKKLVNTREDVVESSLASTSAIAAASSSTTSLPTFIPRLEDFDREYIWEYICHDPNSGWPKIWPMTPGQRFDLKGSSYTTLAVNQNTLKYFFLHIHHIRVLPN